MWRVLLLLLLVSAIFAEDEELKVLRQQIFDVMQKAHEGCGEDCTLIWYENFEPPESDPSPTVLKLFDRDQVPGVFKEE